MAAFGRRGAISAPVGSVQPASLHYSQTSTNAANILQDKIEKLLRDSLMKWRRTNMYDPQTTIFRTEKYDLVTWFVFNK